MSWLMKLDWSGLKAGMQKYGKTGIYTYLALSTTVTTGFYVAIEQHVDVRKILGIEEKEEQSTLEKVFLGKGSNLALAVLCSKMLVPVKVPVAAALTPYVHRAVERVSRSRAVRAASHGPPSSGL